MDDHIVKLLQEGEAAARNEQRAEARRAFRAVLAHDSTNLPALLWMAWLSENPRASVAYANRALALDPDNARARRAKEWAQTRTDTSPPHESDSNGTAAHEFRLRWQRLAPLVLLGSVVAFIAGMLLIFIWYAPEQLPLVGALGIAPVPTSTRMAALLPSPSEDPTPSPTPEPTIAPTQSGSGTPTPAPASSSTAAPTSSPSPSSTPTQTASPTVSSTKPSPTANDASLSVPVGADERWINIDLSQQQLTAYEGDTPVRTTLVSTGLPRTPTPVGQYRIYVKLIKTDMRGPDYHLRDVPYTMYFSGSYGIHGTYWHSNFGQPMSAGCVNLPTPEAEWLFDWASVGTLVNIHD